MSDLVRLSILWFGVLSDSVIVHHWSKPFADHWPIEARLNTIYDTFEIETPGRMALGEDSCRMICLNYHHFLLP
jgi:hypothetical protein